MAKGKRAALYLRVSTDGQTTDNQRRVLMEVAERRGLAVTSSCEDAGISGAKANRLARAPCNMTNDRASPTISCSNRAPSNVRTERIYSGI